MQSITERAATIDEQEEQLLELRATVDAAKVRPGDREAAQQKADKLAEIDSLLAQVSDERRKMRDDSHDVDRFRSKVRTFWREETVATTMHEACHQIAFATGISKSTHPVWLNEGLATLFEASQRGALDPYSKNHTRLADLQRFRESHRGGDLRRLVTGVVFTEDPSAFAYAEAWAFTSFLLHRHPGALRRLLMDAPSIDATKDPSEQALERIREVLGSDLDRVEREWKRYVETL